jgi:flagellar biosynthesis protein FliR
MGSIFALLNSITEYILPFFMIFTRLSAVFLIIPFFSSVRIPNIAKLIFALSFTILIFPLVSIPLEIMELNYFEIFSFIATELFIGLILGFFITLMYAAIQMAGAIIDISSGFHFSSILDPLSNIRTSVAGNYYGLIATTLFFVIGGHNMLIRAIYESYLILPLGKFEISARLFSLLIRAFGDVAVIAFKIAAPIVVTLLLVEITLAVLSRAIPQMHVFIIGFPLRIATALVVIGLSLVNTVPYFQKLFDDSFLNINHFLKVFHT